MPKNDFIVRKYEARDRAFVRKLCCDTANLGAPVETFFDDRELFADLWTRYYTDQEPEHTWVVEARGQVEGYLTAAWNAARFKSQFARKILPRILLKAIMRGVIFQKRTWKILWNNRGLWRASQKELVDENYPVHFHINLSAALRGRGAGVELVRCLCAEVQTSTLTGVCATTSLDNGNAIAFFKRLGFKPLQTSPNFVVEGQPSGQKLTLGRRCDEPFAPPSR